jgi:hypothetical protein
VGGCREERNGANYTLYGKAYHLWQTDKGNELPLGEPQLMTSYTADGQLDVTKLEARDERFQTNYRDKRESRKNIPSPTIHKGKLTATATH